MSGMTPKESPDGQFSFSMTIASVEIPKKHSEHPLRYRQALVASKIKDALTQQAAHISSKYHNQLIQFIWRCIQNNEEPSKSLLREQIALWEKQQAENGVQTTFLN